MKRVPSQVILVMAHGKGQVVLCEHGSAREFVSEGGSVSQYAGAFIPEACGVSIETSCKDPGVYVAELRIVNGGAESWEMPHIRDYYAEIRNLRPITEEEWRSHLEGEWPEGWRMREDLSKAAVAP